VTISPDAPDLGPLLERIRQDARKEANRLAEEAEAQAEGILAEARSEARDEYERIKAKALGLARQREAAQEAEARRRGRFRKLAVKHRLLEELFHEAQATLRGDSKESFLRLVESLLLRYAEPGSLVLIVDPAERPWLDEQSLKELQQKLDERQKGVRLEAVEEREGLGGGIVLNKGRREIDASLPSLLGQLRDISEAELSEELFLEEEDLKGLRKGAHAASR
jgi:vacuolar-type H+-ATPase subunit E/Vma4